MIEQFRKIAGEELSCEWTGRLAGAAVAAAVKCEDLGFVGQFRCDRVPDAAVKSKRVDQYQARRAGVWRRVERVID